MEDATKKKELVKLLIKNNILISPDLLDSIDEQTSTEKIIEQIKNKISSEEFLILNKDLNLFLQTKDKIELNFKELDKTKATAEKNNDERAYKGFLGYINTEDHRLKKSETIEDDTKVNVLFSYKEESKIVVP